MTDSTEDVVTSPVLDSAPKTHVILVAFELAGGTRSEAFDALYRELPTPTGKNTPGHILFKGIWIAEDDRPGTSDNHSAVFVPKGWQNDVEELLRHLGIVG